MEVVGVHLDAVTRKAQSLPVDVRERALAMVRAKDAVVTVPCASGAR